MSARLGLTHATGVVAEAARMQRGRDFGFSGRHTCIAVAIAVVVATIACRRTSSRPQHPLANRGAEWAWSSLIPLLARTSRCCHYPGALPGVWPALG